MNPELVDLQSNDSLAGDTDPVCGMRVDSITARDKNLVSHYHDADYVFCGKGCKLEFDDDPGHFLAAGYAPSM
jgi:YHS domain-containing protein